MSKSSKSTRMPTRSDWQQLRTYGLELLATIVQDELKNARLAQGWTIEQLSEEIDVDPTTISRWERERQKPHPPHLLQLSQIFSEHYQDHTSQDAGKAFSIALAVLFSEE